VIQNTFLPEAVAVPPHEAGSTSAIDAAILTGASSGRAATYARRIKNKTAKSRAPARRPPAKPSAPAAPPKPASPAAATPEAVSTPAVASGELQRLRDELQRVNQELSRIGRITRPDAARQTHLPEKQELLRQKADLDRKIRAGSKT